MVEVRGADVHLLAAEAQPEFGAILHRAVAAFLLTVVEVGEELIVVEHAYSHKRLCFVVHLCTWLSGEPQPLASQQVRWVRPEQLGEYPFPAANAQIIAALLGAGTSFAAAS